jgi:NADPH:quinone reductase-like Zn-dependent oxidoreductase
MKAAVYNRYGRPEVVEIKALADPSPAPGQLLVRVEATTVCAPDWRFRRAEPPLIRIMTGLMRPAKDKVLGFEFAGRVAALGEGVTQFAVGDAVFGAAGVGMGAHAELLCVQAGPNVQARPPQLTPPEAAAIPYGGTTALHFLRKAGVKAGDEVLIYGASGGVGVSMIQLAKHFGARVTAVASARNQDLVRRLGADRAIDYATNDFSAEGAKYDVVADCVGKATFAQCRCATKRSGTILQVAPSLGATLSGMFASGGRRVVAGVATCKPGDIAVLAEIAAQGALKQPIEQVFPLADIVEAHRLSESGRKRGHVAVAMDPRT